MQTHLPLKEKIQLFGGCAGIAVFAFVFWAIVFIGLWNLPIVPQTLHAVESWYNNIEPTTRNTMVSLTALTICTMIWFALGRRSN